MIECLARNGFTYESIGDAFGVTRQRIEQTKIARGLVGKNE